MGVGLSSEKLRRNWEDSRGVVRLERKTSRGRWRARGSAERMEAMVSDVDQPAQQKRQEKIRIL